MHEPNLTKDILLDMLGCVLIEMRNHTNKKYAPVMADVFHNVPARLILGIPAAEIYCDMQRVAKRHGVEEYLSRLLDHSTKKAQNLSSH